MNPKNQKKTLLDKKVNLENLKNSCTMGSLIKSFLKMSKKLTFKKKGKCEACLEFEKI